MNKKVKRFLQTLSIVLSLALLIGMTPAIAFAETVEHTTAVSSSSVVETSAEATALYEDTSRREENVKHYRMSDGTYTAISYSQPVHYLDAGTYREIDNTLYTTQVGGKSVLRNRSNAFTAAFPSYMSSADEISMTHGNHQIFWKIGTGTGNTLSTMSAVLENRVGTAAATETATLAANTSAAMENISMSDVSPAGKTVEELPGLALSQGKVSYLANPRTVYEYTVTGNKVKESIILASVPSETAYTFTFRTPGLTAQLQEDGSVVLSDGDGEEVFVIEAPYMQDAQGALSTDIEVTLQTTANGFVYTITPDAAWLNADDRTYPVVIDPTIGVQLTDTASHSATYSKTALSADEISSLNTEQYMYTGYYSDHNLKAMFYSDIPAMIPDSAQIINCTVHMQKVIGYTTPVDIQAHRVMVNWMNDTTCYNTTDDTYICPTGVVYDSTIVDHGLTSMTGDWVVLNITGLAQNWHIGKYENYGILLSTDDYYDTYSAVGFAGCGSYSNSIKPYYVYSYYDTKGTESYWSYAGADIGSSGSAMVNLYNGKLFLDIPLLGTSSELLPAGLSLTYDAVSYLQQSSGSRSGLGTKLNYDVRIESVSDETINSVYEYKYIDSDGTELYLMAKDGATDTYVDELGYDYTFVKSSSGWTMTDHTGNKMLFNSSGRLTSIQPNNTTASITIGYGSSNRISSVTDGAGDILTLSRNSAGYLTSVSDSYGRTVTLSYDASYHLTQITHYDGRTTLLTYSNNRPTQLIGADGRGITVAYGTNAQNLYRVQSLAECSRATSSGTRTAGNSLTFDYLSGNATAVTDSRGIRTVSAFDNWGRCVSRYNDFGAATVSYEGGTATGSNVFNISETSSVKAPTNNLLTNHSFENGLTGWTSNGTADYAAISTSQPLLGNNSVRLSGSAVGTDLYQTVTVEPGETYTFSAYCRNTGFLSGFGGISVATTGVIQESIDWEPTNGWERLQVTATIPDGVTTLTVKLHAYGTGQAYFDCVQLEKSTGANAYNMLENTMFERPGVWDYTGRYGNSAITACGDDAPDFINKAYHMRSRRGETCEIWQEVTVAQPAETFAVDIAGYAKAFAVAGSTAFDIAVAFTYSDGRGETQYCEFNPDTNVWQYVTKPIVPSDTFRETLDLEVSKIRVTLRYNGHANYAQMSGIGLYVNQNGVRYTYDDNDNLTGVVPLYSADAVSTAFNDNNTVSSENSETSGDWTYTYDEEISTLVDYIVQEDLDIKIDYVYNDFGQLLSTTLSRYDATGTEQTSPVITSSTEYTDDFRHVDFTTSETGLVTTYTYDSKDRVGSVSAGTAQTNYTYQNGTDRLLSTTARVDDTTNASVSYAYDTYGQLTGITRNGMTYTFGYDTFGNRTTVTAGGQLLSSKSYEPNNGMLKYSYDAAGNQTAYTYDEQDRLVSQMYTWNTGFNSMQQFAIEYTGSGNLNRFIDKMSGRTWQYHYDLSGRLHRLTNNKGFGIRYTYDDYDRVIGQRFRFGTSYSSNDYYDISYTYGDLSIPMSVSFSGTTKTRTLDTLGRTGSETLTTTGGANWVTNYGYLSPGSGKTSTVVNSVSMPSLGETYQYIYDENGNINQILRWGSSNPVTPLSTNTYLYDDIGQLTFENGVSYTYDTAGNILSKRYNDGTVIPYTYRTSGWTDQLISYNGQSITYDSNGNALTWRDGLAFTWSNSRQLASVSKNGTSVASYTYDAFGTRATKVVNGKTTTFYYVDDVLYMQDDGTNRIWYYYDATGTRIAMECNGIMSYYIYNLQGDVIGLYDSTGTVIARYTYDSWGKPLTITAANGGDVSSMPMHLANMNPFRYRGYYYDVETGLYYLNSRYYDAEVGRFISADGEISDVGGDVLGLNLYAYCMNNPINMSDADGNWPKWLAGAMNIVGGVAQAVTGAALGIFASWTGIGAVAAGVLIANGAATTAQGIGQVINAVTETAIMREDNIIRSSVQEVGEMIGGETGGQIAGFAYDVTVMAAETYAGKVTLQQAGKLPVKVDITDLTPDPTNPMTDAGINYWTKTLSQNGFKGYNTLPNAYGVIEPISVQRGTLMIANGHHRVAVLQKYGVKTIEVFLVP